LKLLIKLSYRGTAYSGYQIQNNAPTIQGELNKAAKEIFGQDCDISGCSRTDSGVHANEFCATVTLKGTDSLDTKIPISSIPLAFGAHLPADISVREAQWVNSDFHPRYDVKYKEYVYRVWNRAERNPFIPDMCYHYPKPINDEQLTNMDLAAKAFCGEHNFISYMSKGGNDQDTVRNVKYASVERNGDFVEFTIAADGFLYNMVRIMAGTLIYVAEGKILPKDIPAITDSLNRKNAGFTAPPNGLFLNKVFY
jgi:tRNA pseudouridine38-40 synthase